MNSLDWTRIKLLECFEGRENRVLSGAQLADRLEMSRAAIWKHLRLFKKMGFPIQSVARGGYIFKRKVDLSLARLAAQKSKKWTTAHFALNVTSTQRLAKAAAIQGIPEGHLWIAETQSEGRGRLDRRWESGYGGLWFSLILRPKVAPAEVPPLTQIGALSLVKVLSRRGVLARLKWPNDVVVYRLRRWQKLAGILTEMSGEVDRTDWVVMGIGLNVFNVIPAALKKVAAAVEDAARRPSTRADLLNAFLREFEKDYRSYQKNRFQTFQKLYWKYYSRPDQHVTLQTAAGQIEGKARGVDPRGGLLVESNRRILTIFEGEIIQ